jgi:hypothetical protein
MTEDQFAKAVNALAARLSSVDGWLDVSCCLTNQGLLLTLPWQEIAFMALEEAISNDEVYRALNDGWDAGLEGSIPSRQRVRSAGASPAVPPTQRDGADDGS